MLFDSLNYWIFFGLTLVVLAVLAGPAKRIVLVGAGLVFYSFWNPWFVLLLGGSILGNFYLGRWIGRTLGRPPRVALATAIAFNLALLGFFKYSGFIAGSLAALFHLPAPALLVQVILPVGISFFTFEGIAYAVDVYRRDTPASKSLTDFAVFMSFFPHLVAGPIIRPAHFFPQLHNQRAPGNLTTRWGFFQIFKGLLKKIVFADYFGPVANAYFSGSTFEGCPVPAAIGVLAFSLQIYFDFAGYTDIARGCALLLGFEFPPNFERPYLSRNITDFWRRWHISLSNWLRDYLYIPLGGNRDGKRRTYLNIFIVMAVGGLWHGASWNFVIWGIYNGILLLLHRFWTTHLKPKQLLPAPINRLASFVAVLLTFTVVTIGWIPFRSPDFTSSLRTLAELGPGGGLQFLKSAPSFAVLCGLAMLYCLADPGRRLEHWTSERAPTVVVAALSASALVLLQLFGQFGLQVPFIYFQF